MRPSTSWTTRTVTIRWPPWLPEPLSRTTTRPWRTSRNRRQRSNSCVSDPLWLSERRRRRASAAGNAGARCLCERRWVEHHPLFSDRTTALSLGILTVAQTSCRKCHRHRGGRGCLFVGRKGERAARRRFPAERSSGAVSEQKDWVVEFGTSALCGIGSSDFGSEIRTGPFVPLSMLEFLKSHVCKHAGEGREGGVSAFIRPARRPRVLAHSAGKLRALERGGRGRTLRSRGFRARSLCSGPWGCSKQGKRLPSGVPKASRSCRRCE